MIKMSSLAVKSINALYKLKDKVEEKSFRETLNHIFNNEEFTSSLKEIQDWSFDSYKTLDRFKELLNPPKGERGFFVDIYGNRVSYNGIKSLKRPGTELWETEAHRIEYEKCKNSFKYFRRNYVIILTAAGYGRPEMRKYQVKLEDTLLLEEDTLVFFSRQSGKSVTIGTYLLWKALFHPYKINIGIVANRSSTAKEILTKMKRTYLELPIWLQKSIETWNKSDISFGDGTTILTDAPSSDSFRSHTINILYGDEVAYIDYEKWIEMSDAVFPTMNSLVYKQTILSSTANGMNHWEELVRLARKKENGYLIVENDWKEVPHYDKTGNLLSPEEYRKRTIAKYGLKYFLQTEENRFLGSSDTLIEGEVLEKITNRLNEIEEEFTFESFGIRGLKVIEKPQKGHIYIISVDAAKDGKDAFSIQIVDVTRFPFRQIGTANLQVNYLDMPEYLEELGKRYNNALIVVENNDGAGQSVADFLFRSYEYENLHRDKDYNGKLKRYPGFRTTSKSRDTILKILKRFIEEGKLEINFRETLSELYTFTLRNGKYQAESGYHDDNVMSLAVVFAPFIDVQNYEDFKEFLKSLKTYEWDEEKDISDLIYAIDVFSDDGNDFREESPVSITTFAGDGNDIDYFGSEYKTRWWL